MYIKFQQITNPIIRTKQKRHQFLPCHPCRFTRKATYQDKRCIEFNRKYNFKSLLWIFDRLTIPIAIGGAFVRVGNFFNSEILGKYTNSNWGVIFENRGESLPRHPAQLYESFGYVVLFIILYKLYNSNIREKEGILFGYFLIGLFTIRFLIEFVK